METAIDDPPASYTSRLDKAEVDYNDVPQHRRRRGKTETRNDEPPSSERRRRRRKDKKARAEESPPPRQRRREKVETLLDDPPEERRRQRTDNHADSPQDSPRKRKEKRESLIDDPPAQRNVLAKEAASRSPKQKTQETHPPFEVIDEPPKRRKPREKEAARDPSKERGYETPAPSSEQPRKETKDSRAVSEEKRQEKYIPSAELSAQPRKQAKEDKPVSKQKRQDTASPSAELTSDSSKPRKSKEKAEDISKQNRYEAPAPSHDSPRKQREEEARVGKAPQTVPQRMSEQRDRPDSGTGTEGFAEDDLNPENHQLSDFKELCKSVASLLHIEDQAAAAMLTEPLSSRRDLVEGLDAEAIFDYLTQHGVLDNQTLQTLRSAPAVKHRNLALLQHVEKEGHNAVALFINALRQSGQLHLASSLDNTRRIQPVSEGDYFEKQRHKGELTIIIKVHALLIVVPERDSEGDVIDSSMLASPQRGLHQSYDNMLMMDDEPVVTEVTDDEEDYPKKKSFFCFCFPSRAAKKQKMKEKKYAEQYEMKTRSASSGGRSKSGERREKNSAKSGKSSTVSSPQHTGGGELADVPFSSDSRRNSGSPRKEWSVDQVDQKNGVSDRKGKGTGQDKENADPVIMEYNKQMELVRLKAQRQGDRTRTISQSSAIVMCEKWKSGGQYFRKKLTALCEQFEFDLQTYIIKYIEQDRGTLVLSVWTDRNAMYVSNICMTRDQVRQLHKDYMSGALRERLDALLRTNQCLQKLDIKDMDLRIVIEEAQFQQAIRELA